MDSRTYQDIASKALMLVEFHDQQQKLMKISSRLVGSAHKEFQATGKFLDSVPTKLFKPPIARAYAIYRLLGTVQDAEAIAQKLGVSTSTVRQTILALRSGGVDIQKVAPQYKIPEPASNGQGAAYINADASNDERAEAAIADVKEAVAKLSQEHDWDSLTVPQKIKLLQAETLEMRGAAISRQTLYREWIRDLW